MDIEKDKPRKLSFPRFRVRTTGGREGVKKLPPVQRAGRDVGKVLQRYLFTLTTYNEQLYKILTTYRFLLPLLSQVTAFVKLWRYSCPPGSPTFFHSLRG
jgi:hypothetical protein